MAQIETRVFSSAPADIDIDALSEKLDAVREARSTEDAKEYAAAIKDLITFHYDSFKAGERYSTLEFDIAFKNDELLASDPRALALVRGALHNKERTGSDARSLADAVEAAKSNFRTNRANVSAHLNSLGGDWTTKGAIELAEELEAQFTQEFERQGAHAGEASFRAKRKVIQTLNDMSTDPKKAFILLTSKDQNASIKLFMDGVSAKMTPVIDPSELVLIRDGINASRAYRFNKEPITVNVMSNQTVGGVPNSVADELEDGDLAFTYFGGNGVYIYPEKVKKLLKDGVDADWFSTETLDARDLYRHLIVHETAHLQMYRLWGNDTNTGTKALEQDFMTFKVKKDGTSTYGNESVSESFAEQYAKYLITGNASPEFLDLLSSKGLTKAQLNKKWRSAFSNLPDTFFKFIDGIFQDDQNNVTPEFNGPEASEYNQGRKYGAARVHKLGRILGFIGNKPEAVPSVKKDEKVVYRGLRGASGKTSRQLHGEFVNSDMPYVTYGIYGDGAYSSKIRSEADGYADWFGPVTMRVKDDANIYIDRPVSEFGFNVAQKNKNFNLRQLHKDMFKAGGILEDIVLNEIDPDATPSELSTAKRLLALKLGITGDYENDRTILAGMLGFQGVEVSGNQQASYAIILDRSMMQIEVPAGGF
ncbi:MAG: hypothetical protein EBS38_01320 [Actinobacteria bacterium]|nr:hypothetical protein [Actinomycetota bacterium]